MPGKGIGGKGRNHLIRLCRNYTRDRAGISIALDLSRSFSLQSGLEYWNKSFEGSLRSYGMLTVITPVHLRVQHLALPLMLRYHLGRSVYFGAGAYLARRIVSSEVLAFAELGPEAVYRIEVVEFPAIVINDIYGGDLYENELSKRR